MNIEKDNFYSYLREENFIIKTAQTYDGVSKSWDLNRNGIEIKNKIKKLWWKYFIGSADNVYGYDGNIITSPSVLEASGHLDNFYDYFVECENCKKEYRIEEILKKEEVIKIKKEDFEKLDKIKISCLDCKKTNFSEIKKTNLLLEVNLKKNYKTNEIKEKKYFLRPETCQTIFSNFPIIIKKNELKTPFGIGQIGKSFRNEMTLNHGIFRTREFEQMELEFFSSEEEENKWWKYLVEKAWNFYTEIIGENNNKAKKETLDKEDRPHYSEETVDFYFNFRFGWGEICSNSRRGDYDLKKHSEKTNTNFFIRNETGEHKIPKIIEISFGVERLMLAAIENGYKEEETIKNEEKKRKILKINPLISPYFVAVMPLNSSKKELVEITNKIYNELKKSIYFETNLITKSSIGKSYRSQDSIGTYFCITIDFQTQKDNTVTCRHRDSTEQIRLNISYLKKYLEEEYEKKWNVFFKKA